MLSSGSSDENCPTTVPALLFSLIVLFVEDSAVGASLIARDLNGDCNRLAVEFAVNARRTRVVTPFLLGLLSRRSVPESEITGGELKRAGLLTESMTNDSSCISPGPAVIEPSHWDPLYVPKIFGQ